MTQKKVASEMPKNEQLTKKDFDLCLIHFLQHILSLTDVNNICIVRVYLMSHIHIDEITKYIIYL